MTEPTTEQPEPKKEQERESENIEVEMVTAEDIDENPFPLDMEKLPNSFKEIGESLKIDKELKRNANKELGEEIKDKKKEIDGVLREFYLEWFEDNKDSEAIQNVGFSPELKISDKVKMKLAQEAGALEDLVKSGQYEHFQESIKIKESEAQHIHNFDRYLAKAQDVPFEIRFEVLNILNKRAEKMTETMEEIDDIELKKEQQEKIDKLFGIRKQLTESIKGESLDDEVQEVIAKKLNDNKVEIDSRARGVVTDEIGEKDTYAGELSIIKKDLLKLFEKDWKQYASENKGSVDVDNEGLRFIFLQKQLENKIEEFKKLFGKERINDKERAILELLKNDYKAEDFKKWRKKGIKNKKTKEKYRFDNEEVEDFLEQQKSDYNTKLEENKDKLGKEWDDKYNKAYEAQTKIVAEGAEQEAINSLIEQTANSPIEVGKTQQEINKRLKQLIWDFKIENEILGGDDGEKTKENIAEFRGIGVENPDKVIRDVYLRQGRFEEIPKNMDDYGQEWMEDNLEKIFGKRGYERGGVAGFFENDEQKKRWTKEAHKRKGFFALFFEIILEILKGDDKEQKEKDENVKTRKK